MFSFYGWQIKSNIKSRSMSIDCKGKKRSGANNALNEVEKILFLDVSSLTEHLIIHKLYVEMNTGLLL